MNKELSEITKKLKARRIKTGHSQTELATACGLASRGHISNLENGRRAWRLPELIRACEFLGLELKVEIKEK